MNETSISTQIGSTALRFMMPHGIAGLLQRLARLIYRHRRPWFWPAFALSLVFTLICLGLLIWFCFWFVPMVWSWGFTGQVVWWRVLIAFLGLIYGIVIPAMYAGATAALPMTLIELYITEKELEPLTERQIAQDEAQKRLESKDKVGLIPLIGYSQHQLESYYTIGLKQARSSFIYGVTAMWIGFVVIITGLALPMLPIGERDRFAPPAGLNYLVVAGGVTIELVSALFLWMYGSAMRQLTYFYDRQIYAHNVLFCYRIAEQIEGRNEKDYSKQLIVRNLLERTWAPDRLALPSSRGIGRLHRPKDQQEVDRAIDDPVRTGETRDTA